MKHIFSIAKEFVKLSFAGDEADPLTNLRLQKLLYYAQAWSLVLRERELFSEDLQAWRYGPVVPEVYRELPDGLGAKPITLEIFDNEPDVVGDEAAFLAAVWGAYSEYSASKLSELTHREAPWIKAWGGRPKNAKGDDPIKLEDLEDFFAKQKIPVPLERYREELRQREKDAEERLAGMTPLDVQLLRNAATGFTAASRAIK